MIRYSIFVGIILLLFLPLKRVNALNGNFPVGARSAALSHSSVMLTGFWPAFHNQASLAYLNDLSAGVSYQGGFIPEMGNRFVGVTVPAGKGSFGFSTGYYGYTDYYEVKGGVGYGMLLSDGLAGGVQIDYFNTHIGGVYENTSLLTFEAGLMYKVAGELVLGFHIFNPFNFQVSEYSSDVPSILRFGASYRFLDDLMVCAEIQKQPEINPSFKLGLEYLILDRFFLRTGVSTYPFMNSFGLGYDWKKWKLNISFSRHEILGYQPAISINHTF